MEGVAAGREGAWRAVRLQWPAPWRLSADSAVNAYRRETLPLQSCPLTRPHTQARAPAPPFRRRPARRRSPCRAHRLVAGCHTLPPCGCFHTPNPQTHRTPSPPPPHPLQERWPSACCAPPAQAGAVQPGSCGGRQLPAGPQAVRALAGAHGGQHGVRPIRGRAGWVGTSCAGTSSACQQRAAGRACSCPQLCARGCKAAIAARATLTAAGAGGFLCLCVPLGSHGTLVPASTAALIPCPPRASPPTVTQWPISTVAANAIAHHPGCQPGAGCVSWHAPPPNPHLHVQLHPLN